MSIILTGDRPTGPLHLGHFVGSLQNRLELQKNNKLFIMIADIQALSDHFKNPSIIQKNILQVLEDYLSIGLNPDQCCFFLQSQIHELGMLTIYFMNLVSLNRVLRNPTVKTELKNKDFEKNIPCGFACYPISQAADILLFNADIIPVGKDQLPMIEQTNEIAAKFNETYNVNIFKECKAMLGDFPKLMGIDGKNKCSKSLNNAIFLNDDIQTVKQKVMQMYTDPDHIKVSDPGKIEGNMVFHYLDIFSENKEEIQELKVHYKKGGLGDVFLKNKLINVIENLLQPIREKRLSIKKDDLTQILQEQTEKAKIIAKESFEKINQAIFKL